MKTVEQIIAEIKKLYKIKEVKRNGVLTYFIYHKNECIDQINFVCNGEDDYEVFAHCIYSGCNTSINQYMDTLLEYIFDCGM